MKISERKELTIKKDLAYFKKKQIEILWLKNPFWKLRIHWEFNNILDSGRDSKWTENRSEDTLQNAAYNKKVENMQENVKDP